jgi:hypothetical protein
MDFSPAHKDKVLATTCEDGTCILWAWERQLQIAALELPAGAFAMFHSVRLLERAFREGF